MMVELTAEIVRELLDCDYESGILTWRIRARKWFTTDRSWKLWNYRFMGEPAFTADNGHGYTHGALLGKRYKSHRIIWLHCHGEWPNHIDHINGTRWDNRIENLRSVTKRENEKNQKRSSRNSSGTTGVSWNKNRQKWHVRICADGKKKHLGYFKNIDEATAVRKAANKKYKFHENHGRNP